MTLGRNYLKLRRDRKGRTYEEIYGEEKAKEMKEKLKWHSKNNPNFGNRNKKFSEEHKQKIGRKTKKSWKNPEYRKKVSFKLKESLNKPDVTKRMSERMKGNKIWDNPSSINNQFKKGLTPWNKDKNHPKYKEYIEIVKKIGHKNKGRPHPKSEETMRKILKSLIKKPNKPEKFLIDSFKKNDIPLHYVGDGQLIIGGRCPDFVCNPSKKVVLLHGDWWHYLKPKRLNPLLTREQVEENDKSHYKKYFFEALIIWEHELKNPLQVINKIKEFIK